MAVRLAANLSLLFGEHDFLDRFDAAARCRFRAVEFQFPYDYDARELRARLDAHGLQQVLFNAPPGDWASGERGIAALPGREHEFRRSIDTLLAYAEALSCPRVHVMSGVVPADTPRERCEERFVANLRAAASAAATAKRTLVLEPLNPVDFPGYFVSSIEEAARLIGLIGAPNVRIQYDLYHQQMHRGALVRTLHGHADAIEHVQLAGVPGRNEPDADQEINVPFLFDALDAIDYAGWVGCEYRPRGRTEDGLGWAAPYGIAPRVHSG
jgi:hydroxypyruvate isomerase